MDKNDHKEQADQTDLFEIAVMRTATAMERLLREYLPEIRQAHDRAERGVNIGFSVSIKSTGDEYKGKAKISFVAERGQDEYHRLVSAQGEMFPKE